MSDPEDPKANSKVNMECLGGCAFLLFGLGLFCFIPGSVLMATYATSADFSAIQIVTYILFVIGNGMLVIGILLTVYWCRASGYQAVSKKADDDDDDSSDKPVKDKGKGKGKNSDNTAKDDTSKGKDKDKKTDKK